MMTIAAPVCLHCTKPITNLTKRHLCWPCYNSPAIRRQYPSRRGMRTRPHVGPYTCKHCGCPTPRKDRRGLCHTCYKNLDIRLSYPSNRGYCEYWHEPTEEELEQMIAEQRANLPPWWKSECLIHGVTGGLSAAELRKPVRDPRARRKTIH